MADTEDAEAASTWADEAPAAAIATEAATELDANVDVADDPDAGTIDAA